VTPDEFQQQIDQRDELVQALTRQLEQAAEQLDRMQRSGGMAGRPQQGGGVPADFARQQAQIGEDVAYLVQQWENTQVAGAMGRIEMQLEELRDLVHQARLPNAQDASLRHQSESYSEREQPEYEPEDDLSGMDLLASLKEAMSAEADAIPDVELDAQNNGYSQSGGVSDDDLNLPDPPEPVDLDLADPEEVRDALEERDRYIQAVVGQLRTVHETTSINSPVNWEELNNAPVELVERLQELERNLNEQLRINEVSMSLERARLSRESTQLEAARIQLEKKLKKHGGDVGHMLPPTSRGGKSDDAETSPRAEKWLNMLRIKES